MAELADRQDRNGCILGRVRSTQQTGEAVLDRAFRLLDILGTSNTPLGLSEISLRADMPKATTYRLLKQLTSLGAIERRGEWYLLGHHLFTLGATVAAQRRLREAALPLMAELSQSLRQVVHLGVLDAGAVLQIEKALPRRHHGALASLGSRRPAHATALGKAILAFLPADELAQHCQGELKRYTRYTVTDHAALTRQLARVRACGFAVEHEEWVPGVCCAAAPIGQTGTRPIAGLSVSGPIATFKAEQAAPSVRDAADEIGKLVGTIFQAR